MADTEVDSVQNSAPVDEALSIDEEERLEEEEKRKSREPPIVFKEILNPKVEFDALLGLVDGKLSQEEQQFMEELQSYLLGDEGSWSLSDGFLSFIGRLLNDGGLTAETRVRTLNCLALAALKDDVILLLHQDRKDHVLMNYAYAVDQLTLEEQKSLGLFLANMFENPNSSEWLVYISEWSFHNQQISNIRVTTKVSVHFILSEEKDLQEYGTAIVHNLACKEVKSVIFDDIAVELTMAILQFFNSKQSEEYLYRTLKALQKFLQISSQEVPQLIKMIGPNPTTFRGTSDRINALIDLMAPKLN